MADFIGFNSFEEIQAYMAAAEDEANSRLTQAQKGLIEDRARDRYWVQFTSYGFAIFGHAWSEKTLREKTAEAYAKYPSEVEYMEDEVQMSLEARGRGYLFGEAWSSPYPQGELGSTHASQVVPISQVMFEKARESGWQSP